jgi:amino acid permease
VIIGQLMPEVMNDWRTEGEGLLSWLHHREFWVTVSLISILPFTFFRRLDSLKYTSSLALLAVVYLFALVLMMFFDPKQPKQPLSDVILFDPRISFLKVLPVFVFGFTCHQNVFSVFNELKRNTKSRFATVIWVSIGVAIGVYLVVGGLGYVMIGPLVRDNLLLEFYNSPQVSVGRIAICLLVLLSYPLQCHPARASLYKVICGISGRNQPLPQDTPDIEEAPLISPSKSSSQSTLRTPSPPILAEIPTKTFWAITACLVIASYILAMTVTELKLVLGLVGATGSTTICYILPGSFYLKMTAGQPWTWTRVGAAFLLVNGLWIMPVCVAFVFIKM